MLDFCNDIRTGWLNDLAKVVTWLGSGWVVFPVAAVAAIALGIGRRWAELGVLLAGIAVIAVMPDAIKHWTERPRPAGGLTSADGFAFPSGHAAQATLYTWLAVTLAWRIRPAITWRTGAVVAGIVVTALIGLSRVYLRVHWLSDVWGGWALGFAGFAAAAAVALIIVHIRNNPRRDARPSERSRDAPAGARH